MIKLLTITPDLRIAKFRQRFMTCLGSLSAVMLLSPTRRFKSRRFPSKPYSSEQGFSGALCVSCVRAEPRQLSPSYATQNNGHPMSDVSALQASITVDINWACSSPSSLLQVPEARKGREPETCLSFESIPIEKTVT